MDRKSQKNEKNSNKIQQTIDFDQKRCPFTIVWTPVPILSWILPFIGHLGIGKSDGSIRDFARPYHVSDDKLAFGKPLKYWILDPNLAQDGVKGWDEGIEEASIVYCKKMHYLFWSNCHSHVSTALNHMKYDGRQDYTNLKLFWMFSRNYRYVSFGTFLKTWLPFIVLVTVSATTIYYLSV